MDPKLFEQMTGQPYPQQQQQSPQNGEAPQAQPQGTVSTAQPTIEFDPQQAQEMLGGLVDGLSGNSPQAPASQPQQQNPQDGQQQQGSPSASMTPERIDELRHSGFLGGLVKATDAPATVQALATGGLKGLYETKDFLFGETPKDQQSGTRQYLDYQNEQAREESPILSGLASGIGQFTAAMVGLGKLGALAKAVPVVGEMLASGQAGVEAMKYGKTALEAGKAALAGAIAFDPHEQRLSNLIQDTPLANPFNAWLAAKPGDSAAEGRLKNAMESLGMDAAIIGTFTGGLKIWKYLKAGDTASASKAVGQLEAQMQAHVAEEQQANAALPSMEQAQPQETLQATAQGSGPSVSSPEAATGSQANGGPVPEATASSETKPTATPLEQAPSEAQGQQLPDGAQVANSQDIPVEVTSTPTSSNGSTKAMEDAGVAKPQSPQDGQPLKPTVEFTPEEVAGSRSPVAGIGPATKPGLLDQLSYSLENAEKDWNTLNKAGSAANAFAQGRHISPDLGAFYSQFRTDNDVLEMVDLGVAKKAEELEAQGFRAKQSDKDLEAQVNSFSKLANTDPASLMGMLEQAGKESQTLTAKMIVLGSMTSKTFQDTRHMATLLRLGDYTGYGSREAMEQAIAQRWGLATTLLKLTSDIRSQGGRTLRANRGKPFDPAMFEELNKDRFYALLEASDGSPGNMKYLADPSLLSRIGETANYIRVNSLISGWTTQVVNMLGNSYMVAARPMERMLGASVQAALGDTAARTLIRQNLQQYIYTGTSLWDGFKSASRAFLENESLIRPHTSEAYAGARWNVPGSQALNAQYFKAWDSIPNLIYNGLSVPLTAVGLPTRTLGAADEFMKQIVYRGKLMAAAHTEGVEQAIEAGLDGKAASAFVKGYVQRKLEAGFDAQGRGLDRDALDEASTATFQQDLLPGTLGKGVQTFVASDKTKLSRLILPFVKTPTNVIRYAVKLTPGLNVLQGEYRAMLWGKMGKEAQAQAIGQMTMGALFMGAVGYLGQDRVTGGGPSDPKVKAQLLATGWRPYSVVTKNEDGTTTYVPFNRYDPVALPFGIAADIQDAIHIHGDDYENNPNIAQAIAAISISLAKNFTSRTYLLSLNQALDALSDPERFGPRFAGGMAQSFVPFSAATRQFSTDPYLRDARSIADNMMQAIPGLSASLPPKYDWLGQKMVNRQGLWTDDNGTLVDHEVRRLSLLPEGSVISAPLPYMGFQGSRVDLRDITLTTGENAYAKYQELAGKPGPNSRTLREQVANLIRSNAYQRAADGSAGTPGTKLYLLDKITSRYREIAGKRIRADKNVRDALMAAQRKVVDHYAHLKQPASEDQQSGIHAIIQGFGAGAMGGE